MSKLIALIPVIFGILVVLTNIIVNCIKDWMDVKNPKRIVIIVAMVLAVITAVALGFIYSFTLPVQWIFAVVIAILTGFVVAHVAMYGYDEGYEDIMTLIKKLIQYIIGGGVHE